MIEIIPAILVKDEAEFHAQLNAVSPFCSWVQLDVVDGEFAPTITWGDAEIVRTLETSVQFEIDLMVNNVAMHIEAWTKPGTKIGRVYFHQEAAMGQEMEIIKKVKSSGIEVGMSLVPETPLDAVLPFVEALDAVLFLGVSPGYQGQTMQESIIANVRAVHAAHQWVAIEVDGGVKPDNIRSLVDAGVSRVAVGSYIFQHPEGPEAAINELKTRAGEFMV